MSGNLKVFWNLVQLSGHSNQVSVESVLNDHMGKITQKWLHANCGEAVWSVLSPQHVLRIVTSKLLVVNLNMQRSIELNLLNPSGFFPYHKV